LMKKKQDVKMWWIRYSNIDIPFQNK
jgi:hypothetical protein